jgi:deazaflavin-dependent oxidoreductase (nitroreductase family)
MAIQDIPKPDFMEEEEWNNLIAARNPAIIRMAAKAHVQAYIDSEGEGGTYITQGSPTCLVGAIGRKSGDEQIAPCNFMQDGDVVYVVGSIAGLDKHPHWALNLEANPDCWVQVKAKRRNVNARLVQGDEKKALWPKLVEFFPLWGHFQKYCDREFLTFALEPVSEEG